MKQGVVVCFNFKTSLFKPHIWVKEAAAMARVSRPRDARTNPQAEAANEERPRVPRLAHPVLPQTTTVVDSRLTTAT